MKITVSNPEGIRASKRVRKLVIVAENVSEQEFLYWLAAQPMVISPGPNAEGSPNQEGQS